MGLYTYIVEDADGNPTGEEVEEIYKWNAVPDFITSSAGRIARRKGVEVIAKVADTSKFGLNGVYNRGLGCNVQSWQHYEQIMAERGLVRESDLGKHYALDKAEADMNAKAAEDKKLDKHLQAMATSGVSTAEEGTPAYAYAAERYWEEVLPAREVWNRS